jgi:hypothetical protein
MLDIRWDLKDRVPSLTDLAEVITGAWHTGLEGGVSTMVFNHSFSFKWLICMKIREK